MNFTYQHESDVVTAALNIMSARCAKRQRMQGPKEVMAYLRLKFGQNDRECFVMLTIDSQYRLINEHEVCRGTNDMVQPFPRELLGLAIADAAEYVVFCHNHPSGDARPSNNDCAMTMQMMQLFGACNIGVIDHIIVSNEDAYSMAIAGVMGKLSNCAGEVADVLRQRAALIAAIGVPA